MRRVVVSLLLVVTATSLPSAAQQPVSRHASSAGALASTSETPHLALMRQMSGDPIVVVHCPWQQYGKPSIEMRWIEANDPDPTRWTPIFFVANYLTENAAQAIYHCQEKGQNLPATANFSKGVDKDRVDFEASGKRNLLDKTSITIQCVSKLAGARGGTRLIFWPLDEWGVDRDTLWLELPKGDFSKSGRILVWFLRSDKVVWSEMLSWPGYPEPPASGNGTSLKTTPSAPAKQPASQ